MRIILVATALLSAGMSLAAPLQALAQPPDNTVVYALDPLHSQVNFSVDRFGLNRVAGLFDDITGEIVLDEAHPERSSVRAMIQIASLETGNDERDGFLTGRFWLRGDTFPAMEFQSTSVRLTGAQRAMVTGNLTLAGATASVTLDVTLNRRGQDPASRRNAVGFSATGALSRRAFGIVTADGMIGDDVRFTIEALGLTGEAAPAPPRPPGAPSKSQ
jgi:polyisoprenoid-binding protein YceI